MYTTLIDRVTKKKILYHGNINDMCYNFMKYVK